jgi:hypothetical protein
MVSPAASTQLSPSGDRKTRFRPSQKNTFGLLPGLQGSCPGATVGAGGCMQAEKGRKMPTCYVVNLMKAYPGVSAILQRNTDLIKRANQQEKTQLLTDEFERFRKLELKKPEPKLYYRLHWSGDVYDLEYARALRDAMTQFPDILFWGYTRCFFAAPVLLEAPNLKLYLSLDPVNARTGLRTYFNALADRPGVADRIQIAYMARDRDTWEPLYRAACAEERSEHDAMGPVMPGHWHLHLAPGRWAAEPVGLGTCPVDAGKLPLEGGCATCQKCLGTRRTLAAIWFNS